MGQRGTVRVIPAKNDGNTLAVSALQNLLLRGIGFQLLLLDMAEDRKPLREGASRHDCRDGRLRVRATPDEYALLKAERLEGGGFRPGRWN